MTTGYLNPVITQGGKAAAISQSNQGLRLEVTHIQFGAGQYAVTRPTNQSALQDPRETLPVRRGKRIAANQIEMGIVAPVYSGTPYDVGEIGIWAGDPANGGTLLAVYSDVGYVFARRNAQVSVNTSYGLTFEDVPADSVTVVLDPNAGAFEQQIANHDADPNAHSAAFSQHNSDPDAHIAAFNKYRRRFGPFAGQMMAYDGTVPIDGADGWVLADGSTYQSSEYPEGAARYANGQSTFTVPDRREKFLIGAGPNYPLGSAGGASAVTLTGENMPRHRHFVGANDGSYKAYVGNDATKYLKTQSTDGSNDDEYNLSGTGREPHLLPTSAYGSESPEPVPTLPPYAAVNWLVFIGPRNSSMSNGPAQFTFNDVSGVQRGSTQTSNAITLSGIGGPSPTATVSGGSMSLNGGPFQTASLTVTNGDSLRARHAASGNYSTGTNTTLTVNGVSDTFTSFTEADPAADTTPDAFTLNSVPPSPDGTYYSNAVTLSGINAPITVAIAGGTAAFAYAVSVNNGPYASSVQAANGDALKFRVVITSSTAQSNTASVTAGGYSTTWATASNGNQQAADSTPDPFGFTSQTVAASTVATSNTVTPTGYNTAAPISVSNGSYSINGGSFTAVNGSISPGQSVTARGTSSATAGGSVTVAVNINGTVGNFQINTEGADTTPDDFSFTPVNGATTNTNYISNTVTITGISAGCPISFVADNGFAADGYSINGGAFVTSAGTINPGDTLRMRTRSSGGTLEPNSPAVIVGALQRHFTVTTG